MISSSSKSESPIYKKIIFIALAVLCLTSLIEPPIALLLGFILSFTIGHPFLKWNGKITKILLQASVVGLGFGMNIHEAAKAGKDGFLLTVITIVLTLVFGLLLGKLFSVNKKTSTLISSGTAICGGSAVAAIAPIINAEENETSIALATIFILNSIALFAFPYIGHLLEMDQYQFGVWSAIAIHDTSSVVGAAQKYGDEALKIATTVKLQRALWIIPLSVAAAALFKSGSNKIKIPYFIFLFIIAMILNTFIGFIQPIGVYIVDFAKRGLTLTLFFIGAGLSKEALKAVGFKPMIQGLILWIFISVISLVIIMKAIL